MKINNSALRPSTNSDSIFNFHIFNHNITIMQMTKTHAYSKIWPKPLLTASLKLSYFQFSSFPGDCHFFTHRNEPAKIFFSSRSHSFVGQLQLQAVDSVGAGDGVGGGVSCHHNVPVAWRHPVLNFDLIDQLLLVFCKLHSSQWFASVVVQLQDVF